MTKVHACFAGAWEIIYLGGTEPKLTRTGLADLQTWQLRMYDQESDSAKLVRVLTTRLDNGLSVCPAPFA